MDLFTNLNNTLENGADVNITLDSTAAIYLGIALFFSIFLAMVAAQALIKGL